MITFPLENSSHTPLYQQIYQAIREKILEGEFAPNTKLPSTRSLSANLGVSRNTVDTAYYQLQAEGYIEAFPGKGFFVCDLSMVDYVANDRTSEKKRYPQSMADDSDMLSDKTSAPKEERCRYDFSPYAIDISHFPFSVWRKLSRQILLDRQDLFLLGDNQGDFSLRQAICQYVRLSRNVNATPEQIIVGAGVDYLLQMLSLVLKVSGLDNIVLENPGYMQAAHIFQNNGLEVLNGKLDEKGLVVDFPKEGNVVYVTPSHQYPLGAVMPFGRREELLHWAYAYDKENRFINDKENRFINDKENRFINDKKNHFIIEDDHDSEFRYKGKPIPSLQGMDKHQKVIYIGTFSKAVAPAIRVGYMILPEPLFSVYKKVCGHYSCTVSRIDQEILARFLSEGYFEKHINRMRKIYREKHDLVLECLAPVTDKYHISLFGEHAGLHVVLKLPEDGVSEKEFLLRARQSGVRLYGIGDHYLPQVPQTERMQGILLGYSNLSKEEICEGLKLL